MTRPRWGPAIGALVTRLRNAPALGSARRLRVRPKIHAPCGGREETTAKCVIRARIVTRSRFDHGCLRIGSDFPCDLRRRLLLALEGGCRGCFDPASVQFSRESKGSQCREHRASEPPARSHVTTATFGAICCVRWSSPSPAPPFARPRHSSRLRSRCASCSARSAARAPRGHFPRRRNRQRFTPE